MTSAHPGAGPARQDPIKAVPVRHPGRWVAIAVIAVLAAMFVHMLLTNEAFQWRFMFDNMFRPPVLAGRTDHAGHDRAGDGHRRRAGRGGRR